MSISNCSIKHSYIKIERKRSFQIKKARDKNVFEVDNCFLTNYKTSQLKHSLE